MRGRGGGPSRFLPAHIPEISWISCRNSGNFLQIYGIVPSLDRKRFPPWAVSSIPTHGISSFNFHQKRLRKISGKSQENSGKSFCSPQTGNIFRSIGSLAMRHPITCICTEFNVQSLGIPILGIYKSFTYT
jgi:hypothetical protein